MKKFLIFLILAVFAFSVYGQELKLSGEAKTGIFWQSEMQDGGNVKRRDTGSTGGSGDSAPSTYVDPDPIIDLRLHSKDDAGGNQGRFRLNMDYDNGNNTGFRLRIQWQNLGTDNVPEAWPYAFGYGNFFDDQLTVAIGKLGGSPWGTGGPELWKDLENVDKSAGMRVEWKPNFIPEQYGRINAGFVLNYFNSDRDQGKPADTPITLALILEESLLGISYTLPDYFHFRFAYKFDSNYDAISDNKITGGFGEDEIVYRVEEYLLKNFVPGLKFWALGHLFAVSANVEGITLNRNYAFIEYEPPELFDMTTPFTAQFRIGFDDTASRQVLHLKPSFYWNFFSKLLSVGASFWYGQDFGNKLTEGSPYSFYEIEPKIQLNFQSSYIALVYNFRSEYIVEAYRNPKTDSTGRLTGDFYEPIKQTQWINLRFCIYF
jgi:hypothetical protein